jgi:hypothetical protein
MGFVRADIWRRIGALGTVGKNANDIRKEISAAALYDKLPVDGTIRAETTKDIVNDILLYKATAMVKVRQAVAARTEDAAERKRMYAALKTNEWLGDNFLHRVHPKPIGSGNGIWAARKSTHAKSARKSNCAHWRFRRRTASSIRLLWWSQKI